MAEKKQLKRTLAEQAAHIEELEESLHYWQIEAAFWHHCVAARMELARQADWLANAETLLYACGVDKAALLSAAGIDAENYDWVGPTDEWSYDGRQSPTGMSSVSVAQGLFDGAA